MFKIPKQVVFLLDTLEANGYEAYVVGGCVRDGLLEKEPHDWDICTSAKPEQTKACFQGYSIVETGIQHGTITILIDHIPYEVTTYRVDGEYLDNRHPSDVQFVGNIKEDLARRDFTINAMAYSPKSGLVDFFQGQQDLSNQVVRCVGIADQRFQEDALRIMRALRFASVYGFTIEQVTKMSAKQNRALLQNIAVERIAVELNKLLCGDGVGHILLNYAEVLGVVIPEILPMIGFAQNNPHHCYDVWEHTVKAISFAPKDSVIRIAMLFHDIGKPLCYSQEDGIGHFYGHGQHSCEIAEMVMKRLKLDNETIHQVKELVLYHDAELQPRNKHMKRWLNKIGEERLRKLIAVKRADVSAQSELERKERIAQLEAVEACVDVVIEQQQCFSLKDLAVNGRDLIAIGVPAGIQLGSILNQLVDMVIEEQVRNEKQSLLEMAKELAKQA